MGQPITGQQLHSFFQDPHFWGRGQSYQNLVLRVNGVEFGAQEMAQGWDPLDIAPTDTLDIVSGVWCSLGWDVGSCDLREVFCAWQKGRHPSPPPSPITVSAIAPATPEPPAIDTSAPPVPAKIPEKPAIRRPVFSI